MNAVDTITPVPNCLMTVKTNPFMPVLESRAHDIGPNTAMALVARMAKSDPIRRGIL